jgi:hypothetical protein
MKFEDFKKVVIGAVKARQSADIAVNQALLEFDLTTLTDAELAVISTLTGKADDFNWKGLHSITNERWDRERKVREAEEAAEAKKAAEEVE